MTIRIGTPTIVGSVVQLQSPFGFGGSRGLRLTNLGTDVVIVANIYSSNQDQEYLFPGQQMVYRSANVSAVPSAVGATTGTAISTTLYAEYSDDPEADFIGTYPVSFRLAVGRSTPIVTTITANGTYTIPSGVYGVRFALIGGGGGGGGGGSALTSGGVASQVGGSGGGAGGFAVRDIPVTPGQVFTVTIGAGGAGGNGGAVNGQAGTNGGNGNSTSVVGPGLNISAWGGGGGNLAGGNSIATVNAGLYASEFVNGGANTWQIGVGGATTNNQGFGYAGGVPGSGSTGGQGGGPASSTLGGAGGVTGLYLQPQGANTGKTVTSTGSAGASALATDYGCGGGGGGGGAPGGAGGAGGNGGGGLVIVSVLAA